MGVPNPLINVLRKLMSSWKTRLELNAGNHKVQSRWIRIRCRFLQGDSYSPVGFFLTEVPVTMLMEETTEYRMGPSRERLTKRTHSLFIDDLKTYQEGHKQMEVANEIIMKASDDTGAV